MMKIRMLTGLGGLDYSLSRGDEREFPKDEALRLIQAGYAVAVGETVERAIKKTPAKETR
jgi:hypothetical protein